MSLNKATPYWNPYLETLPAEDLEKLQLQKFRRIVRWAFDRSRFHLSLVLFQNRGAWKIHIPHDISVYDLHKRNRFDFPKLVFLLAFSERNFHWPKRR